jgi:ribosomal protein S18 acetylase RimI-like enzyme
MAITVRPARREDDVASRLLYVSAQPYYNAFAGSGKRAVRMLGRIWRTEGHTASFEQCHVAVEDGRIVGAMITFRTEDGDRLARRFLGLSVPRLPIWQWPSVFRHLRASATVIPLPPERTLYIDALAVDEEVRRRGVARTLLEHAEFMARQRGLRGVSLDTGLQNSGAQALYEACGFHRDGVRRAPTDRIARAVGGPGFVSYFKQVSAQE